MSRKGGVKLPQRKIGARDLMLPFFVSSFCVGLHFLFLHGLKHGFQQLYPDDWEKGLFPVSLIQEKFPGKVSDWLGLGHMFYRQRVGRSIQVGYQVHPFGQEELESVTGSPH